MRNCYLPASLLFLILVSTNTQAQTIRIPTTIIDTWGSTHVFALVLDEQGEIAPGVEVEFVSADPQQADFRFAKAVTGEDGRAHTVIEQVSAEVNTTYTASALGVTSPESTVNTEPFHGDGPLGFFTEPGQVFSAERATLRGQTGGFVFPEMVGEIFLAWPVDPTIVEVERGQAVAFEIDLTLEFDLRLKAPGQTSLILATVDSESVEINVQRDRFQRGDANASGGREISDGITILRALFAGAPVSCEDAADANDNGTLELTDGVFFLNWLFRSGAIPPDPFSICDYDPSPDRLGCLSFPPCG